VNIYQGAEADDFVNRFSVSNPGVGLLKGTPANDGKVTGMVKVIPYNYDFKQTAKEVKTMKQGDILIAETTSPELMLACKKSIAIVTNQGGLLSHAAIVSREMGIPCIVGAQNATKLLKDGDLVEVDADKGVIRILNAMENIPLEKLYTRERSLFLNYIEHMSTFDQGKTIFGMKNFVYINKDGLTTYWYGLDEIKRLGGAFIQKSSDPTFLKETIAGFSSNWSKVSEYVAGKRKVHSFSELKLLSEDYSAYLNYMKIIYNATEMKGLLPDDFVKKSVSLRVSTQAFVETMDSILKTLIKEKSPRHHEYVDYMLPDEIFSLDQGDLSAKRLAEIKRRKEHGYVIFAGKVHSPYKLEAVLDRNGLRLSVMPKWFKILKRKRTPLINSFILDGLVRYYNKSIDIDYSFKNFAFIYDTWYGDADDFKRLKENILRQYADNPRYLRDLMDVAYDGADELDCFCKKIQKRDLRKRSNAQLSALFEEYSKRILDLVPYIQIAMAEEMIVTERIQAILNARIKDAKVVQDEFLLLASPIRKGYFEQENENLINLAIRIRNSPASLNSIKKGKADKLADKLIEGHLAEFSWIANMEYDGKLWAKGDILPRLQELVGKDAKAILKMSHDAERTKDAQLKTTLKSLKLSRSERALVDVMRELVFFRTYRTDVLFRSYYYVKGLFSEVSKRLGLADEDLFYLFYDEIPRSLAAGRADKKTISERKSGYVLYSLYGETRFDENKELIKSLHELDRAQATGADEIKGAIAFKGKVTGVVKLVMRTEDARKVNDGDILVSSMTKPDYIVAMQKAVGFVTDEGGITCHAAIISREMRKPCIIGTKIATQVLKDGDLIEVDADKGIVKVVKRK
jgi:phosphoenolpyruvate synthase/pyruvate phosphate dikinase